MYVPPYNELLQIPKPTRVKGERWGFCGIAAMSAATSVPPLTVHSLIPDWPGYTPSRMIVATLDRLGFDCRRVLVQRDQQRQWPGYRVTFPSRTALGRIYFGEGKFVDSHWFTLQWQERFGNVLLYPHIYDNADETSREQWIFTEGWNFWPDPVRLKSLYFACPRKR